MTNNGHCQVLLTKAVVTHVVWDIKEKQRPHVGKLTEQNSVWNWLWQACEMIYVCL